MNSDLEGLHEVANTTKHDRVADIVFIHGLGGNPHDTWRYGKTGQPGHFLWPEELGKDLPQFGIWTVGYAAGFINLGKPGMIIEKRAGNVSLKLANAGLGLRPLIFIAHSMGGLIVKSLIVGSQTLADPDRQRLASMVRGIVFCATPHRGSGFANAAGVLSALFGGSQAHVREMHANAEPLDILHDEFIEWQRKSRVSIASYSENIGLFRQNWWWRPVPLGLVVPRASANPGIAGHTVHDVNDDHLTIVKPSSRKHDVYAGVLRFILEAMTQNMPSFADRPLSQQSTYFSGVDGNNFSDDSDSDTKLSALKERAQKRIAFELELVRETTQKQHIKEPRRVRFVNAPPMLAPRYFEDREAEAGLIADFLRDPGACILTLHGRGGVGKTALVCKILRELEIGVFPSKEEAINIDSIVYLSANGGMAALFPRLVSGLISTLAPDVQHIMRAQTGKCSMTPYEALEQLIRRLPHSPTIVLIDNFEDLLITASREVSHEDLKEMLLALPTLLPHALKLVITTQRLPLELSHLSPAVHMTISMTEGLPSPFAERVLRRLDADGQRGLKEASEQTLSEIKLVTRGFPRALEAFYQILFGDPSMTVSDLLEGIRTSSYADDKISRALVGQAFEQLGEVDQKVMQALAIYGRPVPKVALEYLLTASHIYVDVAPTLRHLAAMQFTRREGFGYHVHPIDRAYCLSKLPDAEKKRLLCKASEYFMETEQPKASWKTIEDLFPHFEQFRLRLEAGDIVTAADILDEVAGFLDKHGGFEQSLRMANALVAVCADSPHLAIRGLTHAGAALWRLDRIAEATSTQELLIARLNQEGPSTELIRAEANLVVFKRKFGVSEEILRENLKILNRFEKDDSWPVENRITALHHCSECFMELGFLEDGLEYQLKAVEQAAHLGDENVHEAHVHNLGTSYRSLGNLAKAKELFVCALHMASKTGNPLWKANHHSSLADCMLDEGIYTDALRENDEALHDYGKIDQKGGVANCLLRSGKIYLAQGDFTIAFETTLKALEVAKPLRRPLESFTSFCAEIQLAQGSINEANRFINAAMENFPGARWKRENLLATIRLLQGHVEPARSGFLRAEEQACLWLSRCENNRYAKAGLALAVAGLVSCGEEERAAEVERLYESVVELYPWPGWIAVVQRRLMQIKAPRHKQVPG